MDVPLGEDTDLLPPQSMTDYRSVIGTIGYASSEFRPDLSWETSSLSRQFVTPTNLDAKRANAALQPPQSMTEYLSVVGTIGYASSEFRPDLAWETSSMSRQFVTPTILDAKRANAAFGNSDDGKSHGGRIACLTNKTGHSVASWIFWKSRTIKRVCRSSSASEVQSAVEGYDATMWLLALWKEISGQDLDALLVTDSKSLQKSMSKVSVDGFADGETASDRHGSASSRFEP
jgi:hypothetical protein